MQNLVHPMKESGENFTDKMIVEKVMRTLTPHFDHVIVAIQEFNNLDTLKLKELVGSLEAHELRIVERKGVQDSIHVLQTQTWKKNYGFNKSKRKWDKTQSKKSSWLHFQKQNVDDRASKFSKRGKYHKDKLEKKNVQSYNYEKWGHLAKSFWYKKDKGATKDKDDEGVNLACEY